jgi:uncharacterized RmlC-like cupin family protein
VRLGVPRQVAQGISSYGLSLEEDVVAGAGESYYASIVHRHINVSNSANS